MHAHWAEQTTTEALVDGICGNINVMFNEDEMKAHRSDITDAIQRAYELGQASGKITVTNDELLTAREALEDELVERRDARIGIIRNNGLCIKEKDGTPSDIIRISTEAAVLQGIEAINKARGF